MNSKNPTVYPATTSLAIRLRNLTVTPVTPENIVASSSLTALGSLLVLALAAGVIHLLRRRRTVAAGRAESPI